MYTRVGHFFDSVGFKQLQLRLAALAATFALASATLLPPFFRGLSHNA
jgi:hypothetical protein